MTSESSSSPSDPGLNLQPITDVLDSIYRQSDSSVVGQFQAEFVVSPEGQVVLERGERLKRAREYKLDSVLFSEREKAIGSFAKLIFGRELPRSVLESLDEYELMEREIEEVGIGIFGDLREREQRKFWCHSPNTWYYWESDGDTKATTLLYEIQPDGTILKAISRADQRTRYETVQGEELGWFLVATEQYHDSVIAKIYGDVGQLEDRLPN